MADLVKLGQSVKAKYPQYSNLPDEEVGKRVLAKYPQYSNYGDSGTQSTPQQPSGILSTPLPKPLSDLTGNLQKLNQFILNLPGVGSAASFAPRVGSQSADLMIGGGKQFSDPNVKPSKIPLTDIDVNPKVAGLTKMALGALNLTSGGVWANLGGEAAQETLSGIPGVKETPIPLLAGLLAPLLMGKPKVNSLGKSEKSLVKLAKESGTLEEFLGRLNTTVEKIPEKTTKNLTRIFEKVNPTTPTEKIITSAVPSPLKQGLGQIVGRTETNLRSSGQSGVELADKLKASNRNQGYIRGNYDFNYLEATRKLTPEEKINFAKTLDGVETPLSEKVAIAVEKQRVNDRNIAQLAQNTGLQTRDSIGRTHPFSPLEKYYPHKPTEEAFALMETPKGIENIAAKMVEEGKVSTVAEGVDVINKYIKPASMGIRSPNLRISRKYDLPSEFIEWNPDKVLPSYGERAASDLAFAKQFGPNGGGAKALIEGIRQSGGDYQYAQNVLDAFSHGVQATEPQKAVASVATSLQTVAKLPLAAITNLWQGIVNSTVYKGTLKDLVKDTQAARSQAGYDFALKSGAIEHSLSDISALTESVGTSKWTQFSRKLLGDTKFTGTERFNRIFAANAGKSLIESEAIKLMKNPTNKLARRHLDKLGIDADDVLRNGGVTEKQVMEGAYEFVHQTQYGAGVLDRPLWASHPLGKVVFQFKQFSYGANNFIIQSVVNEAKQGNYGPLMAALTIPIIPGMISKKAKDTIRGNQPKEQGAIKDALEIYANGIGLGIFYDALTSATYGTGSVMSFIGGPTAGLVGDIGGSIGQGSPKKLTKTLLPYIPAAMSQTPLKPLAVPTAVALQSLTKRMFNDNNK